MKAERRGKDHLRSCWLLALALAATSAWPQSGLAEGNAAYQQGDYAAAREAYEKALAAGRLTVPLLYNLGTAELQLELVGPAVLHLQQALVYAPRDDDVRANLQTALVNRQTPTSTGAPGSAQVVFGAIVGHFTLNELAVSAGLLYLVACLLALGWLRRGTAPPRRWRWSLYAAATLALLVACLAIGRWAIYHDPGRSVVIADASLMSGPSDSFQVLRKVYEGEMAQILSRQGVWREVRVEGGARGWVLQSQVQPVMGQRRGPGSGVRDPGTATTP